jgi:hypothetical protein
MFAGSNAMLRPIMALTAAVALAAPALAQTVGVNAAIRNKVLTKPANVADLRPAVLKARVTLGEQVVTAGSSMLQILLLDRSNFTVGANARVTIDKFVYDPNRSASAVAASVARGAFRFMSSKSVHKMPGQTAVRTPVASIGVRGTVFEGVVGPDAVRIALGEEAAAAAGGADQDSATLVILRGPAATATTPGGAIDVTANGQTITLDRPGLALFVPGPGANGVGPFPISDKGLLALDGLLRTTPDTRGQAMTIDVAGNPIVDKTIEAIPPIRGQD